MGLWWYGKAIRKKAFQTSGGIYGQRFSNGKKIGEEFRVNAKINGNQVAPAVAGLNEAQFVVVWQDSTVGDIYGRVLSVPKLINNTLFIVQGGSTTLTPSMLSATTPDTSINVGNLLFTITDIEHGYFKVAGSPYPTPQHVMFSQQQLTGVGGPVIFVHDNSDTPPSYVVSVSENEGDLSSLPKAVDVTFDVAPVLVNNQLAIQQAQSVILDTTMLSATDRDNADASLQFNMTDIVNGHFELNGQPGVPLTAFIQQLVTGNQIIFLADGVPQAPSYKVSVSDGQVSTQPAAADITFDPPVLGNHEMRLNQGQTIIVTSAMLSATDLNTLDTELKFTVSGLRYGQFELVSQPGLSYSQFSQQQIKDEHIKFDNNWTISLIIADVTFDVAPVLVNNQLAIQQAQSVILDTTMLSATDRDNADASLQFNMTDIVNGHFELNGQPGVPLTAFIQQLVTGNQIIFLADGVPQAPSYKVSVSDGQVSTQPAAADITFDPPVLGNHEMRLNQGQTIIVTSAMLSATDLNTLDTELKFTVSGLRYGQFELVSQPGLSYSQFSQQQIKDEHIKFVVDDTVNAPVFSVSVSDDTYPTPPQPAIIYYNRKPQLVHNTITVQEGTQITITGDDLSATDPDSNEDALEFAISDLANGHFELANQLGNVTDRFSQWHVKSGQVVFEADPVNRSPRYKVSVSDSQMTTKPAEATVIFDLPTLLNNVITIDQAETLTLTAAMLSATDLNSEDANLLFIVSGVSNGQFELNTAPGKAVNQFIQQQIERGEVVFVQDGSPNPPSYRVVVSDGQHQTQPEIASVTFLPSKGESSRESSSSGSGDDNSALWLIIVGAAIGTCCLTGLCASIVICKCCSNNRCCNRTRVNINTIFHHQIFNISDDQRYGPVVVEFNVLILDLLLTKLRVA